MDDANGTGALANHRENIEGPNLISIMQVVWDVVILIGNIILELGAAFFRVLIEPAEKNVDKEIVLITGAGHGIGKEMALQYGALGATVVCWDINDSNNKQTVKDIKALKNGKAHSYVCDVANREEVIAVAKMVQQEVGDVTILINNAGVMYSHPLLDHTPEEIQRTFDINVVSHLTLIQQFLPSMIASNHGHIVAVSSIAGLMGDRYVVPYCASKFAVRGYMEALYEELRIHPKNLHGIKFTSVFPYIVDTGMCKVIRIRFPSVMPVVTPAACAAAIVRAQRQNREEITIPTHLYYVTAFGRMLPRPVGRLLKDFAGTGAGSDLNVKC